MSESTEKVFRIQRGLRTRVHSYPGRLVLRYEYMSESDVVIAAVMTGLCAYLIANFGIVYAGGFVELLNPFFIFWYAVIAVGCGIAQLVFCQLAFRSSFRSIEISGSDTRFRTFIQRQVVVDREVPSDEVIVIHAKLIYGDRGVIGDVAMLGVDGLDERCWVPVKLKVVDRERSDMKLGSFRVKVRIKDFDCTSAIDRLGLQVREESQSTVVEIN